MGNSGTGSDGLEIRRLYARAYINLLDTYKENIKNSTNNKIELKDKFFIAMCIMMGVAAAIFLITSGISLFLFVHMVDKNYQSVSIITGAVTAMLSTFATMAASIFVLPKMVAEKLFDQKEDDIMADIIENIQKYETNIEELEHTRNRMSAALNHVAGRVSGNMDGQAMEDAPNSHGDVPSDEDDTQAEFITVENQESIDTGA